LREGPKGPSSRADTCSAACLPPAANGFFAAAFESLPFGAFSSPGVGQPSFSCGDRVGPGWLLIVLYTANPTPRSTVITRIFLTEFTFVLLDESVPGRPARQQARTVGSLISLSVGMIEKSAKKCYVNLAKF
jgi:hypothetical protein